MHFSFLTLAALPLATQAIKFLDENNFVEREGMLRFPMKVAKGATSRHLKRQTEAGLANQQTGFFYTIELVMGTPGRAVNVNFDTGSSELWVNPNCAKSADPEYCKSFGLFGESSSFNDLKNNNTLRYGRGSASIEYGYDYVTVGSAKINQQVFGVAYDSDFHTTGIMGAGPSLNGWDSPYSYVLDNLLAQKFIKSRAFSLDLRHIGSDRGAVVFGGIDTKKFTGHLEKRPIIPAAQSPDGKTRYWIYLDGITITNDDGSELPVFDQPNGQAVLLDSGYTVSALPTTHFTKILQAFPSAKKDDVTGQYIVDCAVVKSTKGSINYKFGKTMIKVPFADFIWQQPQNKMCVLGVIEDNAFPVLGDTFLRAAYAVFDWDNRAIHLAPNQDCGSNLMAIGTGVNSVPDVEGDCGKKILPQPLPSSILSNNTAIPTGKNNNTAGHAHTTGFLNATSILPTLTSTIRETKVYTVTSCAPTITKCPVGKVTTEVRTRYTTYCPSNQTHPTTTSKYTKPPCSEVTSTIILPKTIYCTKGMTGCNPGQTITSSCPATVEPITTGPKPTQIPGCTDCALPKTSKVLSSTPVAQSSAVVPTQAPPAPTAAPTTIQTAAPAAPCTTCGAATQSPPPVTAGATKFLAPGAMIMAACALVAAAL